MLRKDVCLRITTHLDDTDSLRASIGAFELISRAHFSYICNMFAGLVNYLCVRLFEYFTYRTAHNRLAQ
jgi:hypothetical protein